MNPVVGGGRVEVQFPLMIATAELQYGLDPQSADTGRLFEVWTSRFYQ